MSNQEGVDDARHEARRARVMAAVWWALIPLLCVSYWLVSKEAPAERAMSLIIAGVSFAAMAVTYSSKAQAADAKAASYENP